MGENDLSTRGHVWHSALLLATLGYSFRVDHVIDHNDDLNQGNRRTVQRALRELSERGWLSHAKNSPTYRRGPMLEELRDEFVQMVAGETAEEIGEYVLDDWRELPTGARATMVPFSTLEDWHDTLTPE